MSAPAQQLLFPQVATPSVIDILLRDIYGILAAVTARYAQDLAAMTTAEMAAYAKTLQSLANTTARLLDQGEQVDALAEIAGAQRLLTYLAQRRPEQAAALSADVQAFVDAAFARLQGQFTDRPTPPRLRGANL